MSFHPLDSSDFQDPVSYLQCVGRRGRGAAVVGAGAVGPVGHGSAVTRLLVVIGLGGAHGGEGGGDEEASTRFFTALLSGLGRGADRAEMEQKIGKERGEKS